MLNRIAVKVAHLFGNQASLRGYVSTFSNLNCADIAQITWRYKHIRILIIPLVTLLHSSWQLQESCKYLFTEAQNAPCLLGDFMSTVKAKGTLNILLFGCIYERTQGHREFWRDQSWMQPSFSLWRIMEHWYEEARSCRIEVTTP